MHGRRSEHPHRGRGDIGIFPFGCPPSEGVGVTAIEFTEHRLSDSLNVCQDLLIAPCGVQLEPGQSGIGPTRHETRVRGVGR